MTVKFADGVRLRQGTDAGKLAARYVHSGNTVIQPSALNTSTGVWTTTQSLNTLVGANGTIVAGIVPVNTVYTSNIIPREFLAANSHRLEVISDTTFYIQDTTTRLVSYPNAANSSNDLTKFNFELNQPISVTINLASYNLSEIAVKLLGIRPRTGQTFVHLQGTYDGGSYEAAITNYVDGKEFQSMFLEMHWKYEKNISMLFGQGIRSAQTYWNDAAGTWTIISQSEMNTRLFERLSNFKITGIKLAFPMANNYTVDIYDLRGE